LRTEEQVKLNFSSRIYNRSHGKTLLRLHAEQKEIITQTRSKTFSQKKEKLEENGISLKHQLVNNATQQLKREIQCIKN
jgi:hypothetical protein